MPSIFNTLFGIPGKSKSGQVNIPDFQVDPYYTSSQDTLSKTGNDILSGNLNDYYKPIGEFGGSEFQKMLDSVIGKTNQSSQEQAAIQGTGRSGVALAASNDALKSVIPQLSYADFLRAMEGRGALLNTGINTIGDVGNRAINQENLVNSYNTNKYKAQLDQAQYLDAFDMYRNNKVGQMYSTLINGALGAATGGMTGGPTGALAGATGGMTGQPNAAGQGTVEQFMQMLQGIKPAGANTTATAGGGGMLDSLGSFSSLKGFADIPDLAALGLA